MTDLQKARQLAYWIAEYAAKHDLVHGWVPKYLCQAANTIRDLCDEIEQLREPCELAKAMLDKVHQDLVTPKIIKCNYHFGPVNEDGK